MERAVIVYNPNARNAPKETRLRALMAEYATHGWDIELWKTVARGHGVELAREAARGGANVVFACGGDGTINEVVNGLVHTESALAVIRGGMGDVLAKELSVPRDPAKAMRVLLDGERHRFDAGMVDERYFLVMAGVGFDAAVVRAVPSLPKRMLGSTSYAVWGAWELTTHYRAHNVLIRIDGEEREVCAYWILLGNTRSYGGIINVTGRALVDDGLLDAYVFEGKSPAWLATTALRLATHRHDHGRGVSFKQVHDFEILSRGLPVQIDGEYYGDTPVRFSVAPLALDVLLPDGRGAELFGMNGSQRPA